MHWWLERKPFYTPAEVASIVRGVLFRMVGWTLLSAAMSWAFAQLAILHRIPRPWVGIIAVAICVAVPLLCSMGAYGYWWWKPRPFRRLWRTVRRLLAKRPAPHTLGSH